MRWLTKTIQEQVNCKRVVVILDVCHSGSAGDESKTVSDADDDNSSMAEDSASKGFTRSAKLHLGGLNVGSGQVVLCSSLAEMTFRISNYAFSQCPSACCAIIIVAILIYFRFASVL